MINKVLPKKYYDKLKLYKNVEYLMNVSDKDLYDLYLKAKVQFLPFIEVQQIIQLTKVWYLVVQ